MNFGFFAVPSLLTSEAGGLFGAEMGSTLTFGERISTGLTVMGVGMLIIFSVLALLWGILTLFRIVFYDIPNKKKAAAPETEPEPAAIESPEPDSSEEDDGELVAAITAAITLMMEEEGKPQTSFRVVSFRRTASK